MILFYCRDNINGNKSFDDVSGEKKDFRTHDATQIKNDVLTGK